MPQHLGDVFGDHEIGPPDEAPAQLAQLHRDIYEAIVRGDQAATAAAMTAHFAGVRRPHLP